MKILVLLIWAIPVISFGQIVAVDFENNDLTGWYENTESRWHIRDNNPINGNFSLIHEYDNTEDGIDWIALLHDPIDNSKTSISWEFSIRYDHNPSSSNNWAVFLSISDLPYTPENVEEAFVFGVNYQGSNDELAFWRQVGQTSELAYSTGFNWEDHIKPGQPVKIKIESFPNRSIQVSIDTANNGYKLIGSANDIDFLPSNMFLLYYKYTSTYDRGLAFDDLKITAVVNKDITPPELEQIRILDPSKIELAFNEIIKMTVENSFCVNGIGCGQAEQQIGKNLHVDLPYAIKAGNTYSINLPQIKDISGNPLNKSIYEFYYPKANDIVISEIMADPNPRVKLPSVEYLELFNRTDKKISLKDWHLKINNKQILLPEFTISPGQYMLICEKDSIEQFSENNCAVLGIDNFPAISNEECLLILSDRNDQTIYTLSYTNSWFKTPDKKEGGWAMEIINPNEPCLEYENWSESEDESGGTPGKANSVLNVVNNSGAPEIYRAAIMDNHHIVLYFSEPLDSSSINNPTFYEIDHNIGFPDSIKVSIPPIKCIRLTYSKEFQHDIDYQISLTSDITDCQGNTFDIQQYSNFRFPELADWNDILINEIMYNPFINEEEFIEFYNPSVKTIDLKDWSLIIGDTAKSRFKITNEYFPIYPGGYVIIADKLPNEIRMSEITYRKRMILKADMPGLLNSGNQIYLYNNKDQLIDKAIYSPSDQHPFFENSQGVSLERISAEMPGDDPNNWQSASSDAGYKTPAGKNSQNQETIKINSISLNTDAITPNSDGTDDILTISYTLDKPGYMGKIMIFDISGNIQNTLMDGGLLGTSGSVNYDGKDRSGNILPTGYYIIYFDAYSTESKGFKSKKTFVIANTK